jgi:Fe-S cluster biosynthesis and repair protein YggX
VLFQIHPLELSQRTVEVVLKLIQKDLLTLERLNVFEPDAKKFLEEQREKFFNNDESLEKAEGLKPEA